MDTPERQVELRTATRLCALTVAWDLLFGGAAVATAAATGSLALVGFGLDAAVDAGLSAVLIWRLSTERRDRRRAEQVERTAVVAAAAMLLGAALYIVVQAARSLVQHAGPETSGFALVQALASAAVLPFLAAGKLRLAGRLGSAALRADAVLTGAAAFLAAVALAGLALDRALGWWWADPAAALVIAGVLIAEGGRAMTDRGHRGRAP